MGGSGRKMVKVCLLAVFIFIYMRKKEHSSLKGFVDFNPFSSFLSLFQACSKQSEIQFWSDLGHQGVDIPKVFLFPLCQDLSELVFSCGSIGSILLSRTMTRACGITIASHGNCHSERWSMHSLSHLVALVASWPGHSRFKCHWLADDGQGKTWIYLTFHSASILDAWSKSVFLFLLLCSQFSNSSMLGHITLFAAGSDSRKKKGLPQSYVDISHSTTIREVDWIMAGTKMIRKGCSCL